MRGAGPIAPAGSVALVGRGRHPGGDAARRRRPPSRLADGSVRGTLALEETGTRDPLDRAAITTIAEPADGGWALTGHKPVVLDGHSADVLYVVAREAGPAGDQLATFAVERGAVGLVAELVPNLDVTRKVARVVLDRAPARRVGPPGDQRAALLRAVDDAGIALLRRERQGVRAGPAAGHRLRQGPVQFGRPIATFQVIKHKIVDMLHQLELARVATHHAAWASAVDDDHRERATAMAKGFVAEAATMITGQSIQVHGGVGFTWDVDCHLLFRRVKANDVLFGRPGLAAPAGGRPRARTRGVGLGQADGQALEVPGERRRRVRGARRPARSRGTGPAAPRTPAAPRAGPGWPRGRGAHRSRRPRGSGSPAGSRRSAAAVGPNTASSRLPDA